MPAHRRGRKAKVLNKLSGQIWGRMCESILKNSEAPTAAKGEGPARATGALQEPEGRSCYRHIMVLVGLAEEVPSLKTESFRGEGKPVSCIF